MRPSFYLGITTFAWFSRACVVQGGEEEGREASVPWVGIVRFEALNQDGEIVGSGCTVDTPRYHDQIRFRAVAGDRVELTERFEAIPTTVASAEAHAEDVPFWCSQAEAQRYNQVLDVSCWRSVAPDDSDACFLESDLVATIEGSAFVPATSQPVAGKTDGFKLSIAVLEVGKQCVQMRCTEAGLGRQQLAFVVE